MTAYEYDNLPETMEMVEPLPGALFDEALGLLIEASRSGMMLAQEIKIGQVYDRKGYLTVDTFGGTRNPSYACSDDDVVLQLTMRVHYDSRGALPDLKKKVQEIKTEAERKQLLVEIDEAEASAAKAKAVAQAKRDRLKELK